VLPAVPPIPKAPGTLLPAFDPSSASPLDDVDETSSSQHSNPLPERFLFWFFNVIIEVLMVFFDPAFVVLCMMSQSLL